ncbi:hypothetical protein [Brevibacillus reuszeri]|uniref:hypothetical protein n=1 Tax=Brevibacillus reuszeri TaxID=54915 RepID=UPI003D22A4C5
MNNNHSNEGHLYDRWSITHYSKFLDAVEEIAPEVRSYLLTLLPLYIDAVKVLALNGNPLDDIVQIIAGSHDDEIKEIKALILREKLECWAEKYRLDSNRLFILFALHFLREVYEYDYQKDQETMIICTRLSDGVTYEEHEIISDFGSKFPFLFLPLPLTEVLEKLNIKGRKDPRYRDIISNAESYESPLTDEKKNMLAWHPTEDTWTEFNNLLNQMFENYKRAYRQRTEEYLEKHGYKADKLKREAIHYRWIAEYQILGKSYSEIANFYTEHANEDSKCDGYNSDTVYRAVKDTASLIGLTLRPDKGGRPSKVKKGRK